jgi:uncharacterized membrane-anchored protein YjiN (DUF445 family)
MANSPQALPPAWASTCKRNEKSAKLPAIETPPAGRLQRRMSADAESESSTLVATGGLRSRRRHIATALLVLMLAIFIVSSLLRTRYPWLAYVCAFAEASTVGAAADWFAVVALFRHPLGLPIPHTAIIPHNQQRIGRALGRFISNNFLAPEVITKKLESFNVADWAASWLAEPDHRAQIVTQFTKTLPVVRELFGHARVRQLISTAVHTGVDSIALAPMLARAFSVLIERGEEQKLFDLGLEVGQDYFAHNKDSFRSKLTQNSRSWIPDWVDARFADKTIAGIGQTLAEMHSPEHPYRTRFRELMQGFAHRLAEDEEIYERCERIKSEVLDGAVIESYVHWLADEAEAWIESDMTRPDGYLLDGVGHTLQAASTWLKDDERVRDMLNRSVREAILATIVPNRAEIADFIATEVARWDSRTLVTRIENQLGDDLQYIRINGTVVGGLVGLVIFIVQKIGGWG